MAVKDKIKPLLERFEGDRVVWMIFLMLVFISIVCIFSSTSRLLDGDTTRVDVISRHMCVVLGGIGIVLACFIFKDTRVFRWASKYGFLLTLILMGLLVSRIDTGFIKSCNINGARRILAIKGVQIHVLEVVKIAMILYMSWAMDARKKGELRWNDKPRRRDIAYIYGPFVVTTVLVMTASNSAMIFIAAMMLVVIFLGGGEIKSFFLLALLGVGIVGAGLGICKLTDGKVFGRLETMVSRVFKEDDEEAFHKARKGSIEYQEALDKLRQPYGAKIAIHEGWPLPKGPGQSTQRYCVPDMSEDYMFSFIVEEYGILGALLILTLYVALLARASIIIKTFGKSYTYEKLTLAGLSLLISGQAMMHTCVNVDLGVMTGQTLPLISHGTSAFLCFCLAFGIILSFSRIATKQLEREQKKAQPLVELRENVSAGLDALDTFESANQTASEELDEFDDYGV